MDKILKHRFSIIFFLFLLFGINIIISFVNYKIDFTEDKKYTLSSSSKKLLSNLDESVYIKVLLDDNIPSEFKKLKNFINDFLEEYSNYSKGKIFFSFVNPINVNKKDSADFGFLDTLKYLGIRPTSVNKKTKTGVQRNIVYPSAMLRYKNKFIGVNFLSEALLNNVNSLNNAEALLEYKISHSIEKLMQNHIPTIAYLTGHSEPLGYEVYSLFNSASSEYKVDTLNLKSAGFISNEKYDLLLLFRPLNKFSDEDKIKIEQYILNGGNALFVIENVYCDKQSLFEKKRTICQNMDLQLSDLLFQYGVKINYDLIQDLQCDRIPVQVGWNGDKPQFHFSPWVYSPVLNPSDNNPITKNIDHVLADFASSLDLTKDDKIKKTILLSSSAQSKRIGTPTLVSFDILNQNDNYSYSDKYFNVGVLLNGLFKSIYGNRITDELKNTYELKSGKKFLDIAKKKSKIIVLSDADLFINLFTQKDGPLNMGTNPYTKFQFGNEIFFMNCLEYLSSESGIIESRNKNFTIRLLNKKKIQSEKYFWQWFNTIAPIALVFLVYGVYCICRWSMYTKN